MNTIGKIIRPITPLFFFFYYGCVSDSRSQSPSELNGDTCFYAIHVPADIDMPKTPHFDTTIVRKKDCKVNALRLQGWGTETSYSLAAVDSVTAQQYKPRSVHFFHGQRAVMDITGLPAGKYAMSLAACGNGGTFTLRIK